jgi:hypothetical protein
VLLNQQKRTDFKNSNPNFFLNHLSSRNFIIMNTIYQSKVCYTEILLQDNQLYEDIWTLLSKSLMNMLCCGDQAYSASSVWHALVADKQT